jgi:hypothetical protein
MRAVAVRTVTGAHGSAAFAVEVWFIVGEIAAAFDHHRSGERRSGDGIHLPTCACAVGRSRAIAATHFCALLFKDCFAREPDAVALNRQHFHQNLIAFFQLVANIGNAMLGDFADVQQSVGAGDDFDERAEIGKARHLS